MEPEECAKAWLEVARLYLELGQRERAAFYLMAVSRAYFRAGKEQKSRHWAAKALKLDPGCKPEPTLPPIPNQPVRKSPTFYDANPSSLFPFGNSEPADRRRAGRLRTHVEHLAETIGERNAGNYGNLLRAAGYLKGVWEEQGYQVSSQDYEVDGELFSNLFVTLPGTGPGLLVGAHYDSFPGSPGANDNATGVAALLELSRELQGQRLQRRVTLVAFVNEEPPYFRSAHMGSYVFAREFEPPEAVLALDMLGCYGGRQRETYEVLPERANFVALVANEASQGLVERALAAFRRAARFPSVGLAADPSVFTGVGYSDHASFWEMGVPALMVTDTGPLRNPRYHRADDTLESVNFGALERVTRGLIGVVRELAGAT